MTKTPPPAGYSGTPLVKKLGIKPGHFVGTVNAPPGFSETLGSLPDGVTMKPLGQSNADIILHFVRSAAELDRQLASSVDRMASASALWLCWAKRTSALATDVREDIVRAKGLAAGVVDIKVAAIDEDWSGHKFVVRLEDRAHWDPAKSHRTMKK